MSDNGEADTEEPAVPLGEGDPVEGAPTARVAARLHYPIEASEVRRREGGTTIRTPDGPRDVDDVLAESDEVYFPDRQSLVDTVRGIVGTGPVPTEGDDPETGDASTDEPEADDETQAADEADGANDVEPENAAEAPEGDEGSGSADADNAAEAADDTGTAADEAIEDEGEFEFDDPEE